uniref:Uncharacterized protein n=1 Tax=Arion vulgaris TaxID=1028688 RepID=A0A0B7AYV9_9EUPU
MKGLLLNFCARKRTKIWQQDCAYCKRKVEEQRTTNQSTPPYSALLVMLEYVLHVLTPIMAFSSESKFIC